MVYTTTEGPSLCGFCGASLAMQCGIESFPVKTGQWPFVR
jgi:hypothetical protein